MHILLAWSKRVTNTVKLKIIIKKALGRQCFPADKCVRQCSRHALLKCRWAFIPGSAMKEIIPDVGKTTPSKGICNDIAHRKPGANWHHLESWNKAKQIMAQALWSPVPPFSGNCTGKGWLWEGRSRVQPSLHTERGVNYNPLCIQRQSKVYNALLY